MAVAADFPVNLKAALQLSLVVHAEYAGKTPILARRLGLLRTLLRKGESAEQRHCEGDRGCGGKFDADHRFKFSLGSCRQAGAAAATGFLASTASAIEAGMGFVFSVKLRIGMTTRKKPK